ncbi:hypothetical protein [Roseomonas sp. USHLN139]|uniref:hypothetical protein n=1 Tax=Roseomonas sp. USHLN139 TaxID=3081298 RepID=UPI003B01A68E
MTAVIELQRVTLALTEVILAETAALERRDLRGAAALSGKKVAALEAFVAARARMTPQEAAAGGAALAQLVDRLRDQVEANRAALQMGIALQGRVLETIAGAAAQPAIATPGYGRQVTPMPAAAYALGAAPMALSLSA